MFKPEIKLEPEKYDIEPALPAWWYESMKTRKKRVEWLREAKFGMFVHWGVYSLAGGEWKSEIVKGYSEHLMNACKIPLAEYRSELAENFNPEYFDADVWIRLCRDAGMKYFVITAKHHDGFAMYDSEVSDYNIVKVSPWGRDPMAELKAACLKYGIKFGMYYSHSQDWSEPYGLRNTWDFPANPNFGQWHQCEVWQHYKPLYHKYIENKAIPQVREIIRKYDPDLMWFDTAFWMPKEDSLAVLKSVREEKEDIIVSSRVSATGNLWGDYKCTNDQPVDFPPVEYDLWEGIPTTNNSYGYHKHDNSYKTPEFISELLLKAVERGGRLLLNVGPCGNGKIDEKDVELLLAVGEKINNLGESFHGSAPSPLPAQSSCHITTKNKKVFVHITKLSKTGILPVSGIKNKVTRAYFLNSNKEISFSQENGLVLFNLKDKVLGNEPLVLELDGDIECLENIRFIANDMDEQFLHVYDSNSKSDNIYFGSGCLRDNYAGSFYELNDFIQWEIFTKDNVEYDISIEYVAEEGDGGTFRVQIDDEIFSEEVCSNVILGKTADKYQIHKLGSIKLNPGKHFIKIFPESISGSDLFHPKGIFLHAKK